MGRKYTPQPLQLADAGTSSTEDGPARHADGNGAASAETATLGDSQRSPPLLASRFAATKRPQTGRSALQSTSTTKSTSAGGPDQPRRPSHLSRDNSNTSPTNVPVGPPTTSTHYDENYDPSSSAIRHAATEGSRRPSTRSGFFSFGKSGSKGSSQLQSPTARQPSSREQAREADEPVTPNSGDLPYRHKYAPKPALPNPSRSELSLPPTGDVDAGSVASPGKKTKSKSFSLLSRTKSNRDRDHNSPKTSPVPIPAIPDRSGLLDNSPPPQTAPVAQDRAFRDMMNSSIRNRSEDRAPGGRASSREKDQRALPSSFKENGSHFFSGLRSSSTKAADMISKGLFGKSSRSGSTTEKEHQIDDEHYMLKVITLPLVEQARKTRISKRLEASRDKTEFWMPAFPWRAIDYLNYKGCDVEGLYRVPGSGPQIKKWQRRFDEELDVNLFEQDDLYDINIIGSMLKAWLRELPDELFPKEAQDRIARECAGATEVPQLLIDELSELSPFNYYLLFAITCHLSLLLAHSDKNKMDFRNLCICFQPCMKIDAFCFKFLVCDWRDCWKGCKNESNYIEEEYRLFDQPPPRNVAEPNSPAVPSEETEAHQPPSTSSSKPSSAGNEGEQVDRSRNHQILDSNASVVSKESSSMSTNVTSNSDGAERARDMRPLSPIAPLSPIGF